MSLFLINRGVLLDMVNLDLQLGSGAVLDLSTIHNGQRGRVSTKVSSIIRNTS